MAKSVIFTDEFCNAVSQRFLRNAGETRDSFVSRFSADPYLTSIYPDDSERGIAADAQWRAFENEVPEDEKEGLKKSMSEPAKAKNGARVPPEYECPICSKEFYTLELFTAHKKIKHGDASDAKNALEAAVRHGLLSNATLQKFATADGYPKPITIKYIMPGLVEYEYMNDGNGARVLVTKNALDKMLADPEKTIVGKPVVNLAHRDVSPDDYKNGKADGIVTDAWYEPEDGWYYCEALVWDEDTRRNMQNGHSVSCEYTALPPWGPAGQLNQVSYDKEVTDGRYKHLAVVSGPRYEGAKIMNSTGGKKPMKLLQWLKKGNEEVKNSTDVDGEKTAVVGDDGVEYPLDKAVTALKNQIAAKAEADALALKNAKVFGENDTITIDGKVYTGTDLKNALAAQVKNASEEKMEKDHKDGEHKGKDMDNCPMCNSEEKEKDEKEKKEEDAKNALLMNSQHRAGQHVQPNEKCAICDGIGAERLLNAAKMREGKLPTPVVPSVDDGLRRGKELMGKTRAQQEAAAAGK